MTDIAKELISLEKVNITRLFTERHGLKAIFKKITDETTGLVPDPTTLKGRDEIAALAYWVSRSKTALEKAGSDLTAEWRAKTKNVNDVKKEIKTFCDDLRDKVREPLTGWEDERKKEQEAEEEARKLEEAHGTALEMNAVLDRLKDLERREKALEEREAAAGIDAKEEHIEQAGRLFVETADENHTQEPPESSPETDPASVEHKVYENDKVAWVFYLANKFLVDKRFNVTKSMFMDAITPEELDNARSIFKVERAKERKG